VHVEEFKESLAGLIEGAKLRNNYASPLDIKVSLATNIPIVVLLDRPRCAQVVLNFVTNAIKYAGSCGEITVSVKAVEQEPRHMFHSATLPWAERYLLFEVKDRGPGVDPNTRDLFSVFSR